MQIATWNVNSIRTRLEHVLNWLEANPVDILCLQETKTKDENFPFEAFAAAGWQVEHHGQPSYNGVALISKEPLKNVQRGFPNGGLAEQKRVIAAELDGLQVINLYVPQGQSLDSPKFEFKEKFYQELSNWLKNDYEPNKPLVVCGDFNIAPAAADVYDAEKVAGTVMFTEQEHGWLQNLHDWGLHDSLRLLTEDEKHFSWWDYRQFSFQRNKGMRIDHLFVTEPLKEQVKSVDFFKDERGRERPSDHIPVVLTLA